MEDKVSISKNTIFIIALIIIILIVIIMIFSLNKKQEVKNEDNTIDNTNVNNNNDDTNDTTGVDVTDTIDESIIYGKYINDQDSNSYIEITKSGYKYYMNTCEGYSTYSSDKYIFTKKITKTKDVYNVTISVTGKDKKERLSLSFTSEFKENDSKIIINGPGSCSVSRQYIKS